MYPIATLQAEVKNDMAISHKDARKIIEALRNLGGQCTLQQLAEAVGRNVNGLSQTLGGKTFRDDVIQDDGNGGDRIVRLSERARSLGPLLDHRPEPAASSITARPDPPPRSPEPLAGQQKLF